MKNFGKDERIFAMSCRYLFFDLDGTLSDSAEGILNAVCYALEKMKFPVPDRSELTHFIGPPLVRTFAQDYDLSPAEAQRAVDTYREYYMVRGKYECRMYHGIEELLEGAKNAGYRMAVATCKPTVTARDVIRHFGIDSYFDLLSGPELDGTRNEKEEVIAYAMQELGIRDPAEVLMIGDRRDDVIGAAKNGIDCAGVLWGFGSEKELLDAGAKYIFGTPAELLRHLAE